MIWRPSGRPWSSRPAGTEMAGRPARLAGTAKTSFRYMAIGSALFSPRREGGARRGRGEEQVAALPDPLEIAGDQRADLLRLVEIGVVEAGREHVGADHDPALDLGAEAGGAGRLVHVVEAALLGLDAQAVADAVVAGEVGRGLGRGDDVIGRQRIFGVRQRDLDDLGAGVAQPVDALLPDRVDLGRDAVDPIFLRDADPLAAHVGGEVRLPVRAPAGRARSNPSGRSRPSPRAGSRSRGRRAPSARPGRASEAKATMPQREQRP